MSKARLGAVALIAAVGVTAVASIGTAQAGTIFVSAKDDIFLAGQSTVPPGTVVSGGNTYFLKQTAGVFGNTDPGAGDLPYELMVTGPSVTLDVTAVTATCGSFCVANNLGAIGSTQWSSATTVTKGPYSVASYTGYQMGLVGVWGTATGVPAGSTAFLIGAGGTFFNPDPGVDTTLYMGTVDSFGAGMNPKYAGTYNDNQGGFTISVAVPEPASWALMLLGFAGLGFAGFRRTKLIPLV